ncbi:hypothetical protein TBH_C1244 [Thiolapillus brandeum]|uniref:Uncharacterized protein n=1 Tax=Thiolapillus brandeum TaxID=1076588 RepID=A0A7U6JH66_9GAMM|nr:hypothetical protein TBH_C1244 [Thiolapillus brandeum]
MGQAMEAVENKRELRFSLGGWLVFALLVHLLLMRQLSMDFRPRGNVESASLPLEVVLDHRISAASQTPVAAQPSADEPAPTAQPSPVKKEQAEPVPSNPRKAKTNKPERRSGTAHTEVVRPPPKIDARQLEESLRSYRLPEQGGQEPFTRILPQGLDSGAFSANTAARINARIREYDGRGGAEVVRVRRFGKKDRCFLVHREGFDVEREDWDPGMETMVGYGAEEIACE